MQMDILSFVSFRVLYPNILCHDIVASINHHQRHVWRCDDGVVNGARQSDSFF